MARKGDIVKPSGDDRQAATFIIRLWKESPETLTAPATWRGTAIHVQSGTERSIQNMDELVGFVATWMQDRVPEDDMP